MVDIVTTSTIKTGTIRKNDFDFFSITEQIEPGRNPIELKFVGNMMPHIPFEWGGEQRISETYYAGNPEPSVQILGSREAEFMIKGKFHDRKQSIGSHIAYEVQEVITELRKRGNLLKLSLGGKWERYGYLKADKFTMRDKAQIEYNLTFFIVGETKPIQNPVIDDTASLPKDISERLKAINLAMKDNILEYPAGYPKDIFDKMSDYVNKVAEVLKVATDAIDKAISLGESTSAGLNRLVGLISYAKVFTHKSSQRVGNIIIDAQVRVATIAESIDYAGITGSYGDVKKQSVTSGYRGVVVTMETQRSIHQAQVEISRVEESLLAYIDTIPIARYLVKQGDSLQTIAVKFYGSTDGWEKILTHNKVSSTLLVSGTILEIPK